MHIYNIYKYTYIYIHYNFTVEGIICQEAWKTIFTFFFFFLILSRLLAQCGAQTHDPGIKSRILYQPSQPGAPTIFTLK